MSKPEARAILNAARDGQPVPLHHIKQALFALGDLVWRKAPAPIKAAV